jgi:surfeit locus 1 family protein
MHFRFRTNIYSIKINHSFLVLCLFFFALFCMLGVWQLHRFHYKKMLLTTYEKRLSEIPKPFIFLSGSIDDLQFQSIAVEGEFVNELTMFIQNRFYEGKSGLEVLTPLRIKDEKKLLLIDRGWLQKSDPAILPSMEKVLGQQHIVGYIKQLNEYQFILGKNILSSSAYPLVMQKIDINEIKHITHKEFYPFIVRLDPTMPNGFMRNWIISATLPERHRMYAIQWFCMALVIVVAFFCFCIERVRESNDSIP